MSTRYIDATAIVPSTTLAQCWHFCRILADVVMGEHCSVGGGTEIGRGSRIGDHSRIGANAFLPPNSRIGRYVFVGPGVVFTDDKHPRIPAPGDPPYDAQPPVVDDGASIGAGCVILPGVHIGAGARIAAGTVVTKDVPAGKTVRGVNTSGREVEPSIDARRKGWGLSVAKA